MNLTAYFRMQDVAVMQLDVYGDCILNSGDEICTSDDQGVMARARLRHKGRFWGEMVRSFWE